MVTKGEGEWGGIKQEFEMSRYALLHEKRDRQRPTVGLPESSGGRGSDPPATQQTPVQPLGREDPLEKG